MSILVQTVVIAALIFQLCNGQEPKKAICRLPKDEGSGRASHYRYFFNMANKKCEPFTFGGGGGNENRFISDIECRRVCIDGKDCPQVPEARPGCRHKTQPDGCKLVYCESETPKYDVCRLPKPESDSRASFYSAYYNMATKKCEEFVFGGGPDNGNRFKSLEHCDRFCINGKDCPDRKQEPTGCTYKFEEDFCKRLFCKDQVPKWEYCSLPKDSGDGRALSPRYFFNKATKKCEPFDYYGTMGNENRFRSELHCKRVCIDGKDCPLTYPPGEGCRYKLQEDGCKTVVCN